MLKWLRIVSVSACILAGAAFAAIAALVISAISFGHPFAPFAAAIASAPAVFYFALARYVSRLTPPPELVDGQRDIARNCSRAPSSIHDIP